MRTFGKLTIVLLFMASLASCGGPEGDKAKTTDAKKVKSDPKDVTKYSIQPQRSTVEWEGTKPGGSHHGTVDVEKGNLSVNDKQIVGGKFVIDMSTIKNEDLTDPEKNSKLVGHLKSSDFFHVEKYPSATFEITAVKEAKTSGDFNATHMITGNLTMKDSTKSITFPAHIEFTGDFVKAQSDQFVIDRSNWNVRYGSRTFFDNLQDKYIHNDIALKVKVTAAK